MRNVVIKTKGIEEGEMNEKFKGFPKGCFNYKKNAIDLQR